MFVWLVGWRAKVRSEGFYFELIHNVLCTRDKKGVSDAMGDEVRGDGEILQHFHISIVVYFDFTLTLSSFSSFLLACTTTFVYCFFKYDGVN